MRTITCEQMRSQVPQCQQSHSQRLREHSVVSVRHSILSEGDREVQTSEEKYIPVRYKKEEREGECLRERMFVGDSMGEGKRRSENTCVRERVRTNVGGKEYG